MQEFLSRANPTAILLLALAVLTAALARPVCSRLFHGDIQRADILILACKLVSLALAIAGLLVLVS